MIRISLALLCAYYCFGRRVQPSSEASIENRFARQRLAEGTDAVSRLHASAEEDRRGKAFKALAPFLFAFSAARPSSLLHSRAPLIRPSPRRPFQSKYYLSASASDSDPTNAAVTVAGALPENFSRPEEDMYKYFASDRVQRVKHMLRKKEIENVLASCQLALQLGNQGNASAIDFRSLGERVNKSMDIVETEMPDEDDLLQRLTQTRHWIQSTIDNSHNDGDIFPDASTEDIVTSDRIRNGTILPGVKLVREDGSLDWDEFVNSLGDRRKVARFGTELWKRLNGKEEEERNSSMSELSWKEKHIKNELVNEEVRSMRDLVNRTRSALESLLQEEAKFKQGLLMEKADSHTLPEDALAKLRWMDARVHDLRKLVTLSELNLCVERICLYLQQEIRDSESDGMDMKLKMLVAELNLIEREFMSVSHKLNRQELEGVLKDESANLLSLVDDEELTLARTRVNDLKVRLALDGTSSLPVIDWGSTGKVLRKIWIQVREGLASWAEGTKMLGTDLQYCWQLIMKAMRGHTLKPREVNTFRRTIKDMFTLIPFTIIMLIPLSPIGHVLVFSFIQRYFPGFFPSCYSEKRLKLRRLYAGVLSKTVEDTLGQRPVRKKTHERNILARSKDRIQKVFRHLADYREKRRENAKNQNVQAREGLIGET